ncbi:hypothetical protein K378_05458 [Streptomyces sp. Amel2xB2]|uniref:Spore-associated protein A n=1 Tax=Streptomyces nanshensis TaxID=518642 RepID=A0A1E7L4Q4_9ACTN|nr:MULTISPECIES: hypothetical protein [Streptomyces]OEV11186.1 hypothetical protein AN218_14135 [Streptomyces nanshensis]RAJ57300.1 hypothetical protein K378_05458 [Streptomyces sp. Amel2xB2]
MRSKRAVLAAASAAAIAVTGMIATAGPASAATHTSGAAPKAAYNGACGSGYSVVNSAGIGDLGTVFLTYNRSTGKNCVVTVRNKTGDPVHMSASVRVLVDGEETEPVVEEGEFTSYAGPVFVDEGAGHCIEWGGVIAEEEYFNSGSNCGTLK